jgi:hypothetical protein
MDEGEAQLLCSHRQQGSHLPPRIAPGRLDLDNVSAKVTQKAAHIGSIWFGDIQHMNPIESPARLLTLSDCHVPSLAINQSCGFFLRRASPRTDNVRIVTYRGCRVIFACGEPHSHV